MFANTCNSCGRYELVFADQVRDLRKTPHGFDVRYLCSCGATATWHVVRDGAMTAVAAA